MLTPWELFVGAALPMVVALAAALVGWRSRARSDARSMAAGRVAGTVAVAVGFVSAWGILFGGLIPFPPTDATSWVVFAVPVLAAWGILDGAIRLPPPGRLAGALVLVSVFAYLLVRPLVVSESLESTQGASAMGGMTVVAMAWWASVELLERQGFATGVAGQNGLTSAGVLVVLAGTTAVILGMSGSQIFAQKGGFLAAGVGGLAVVALWGVARGRGVSLAHGTTLVVVTGVAMLLTTGKFYSEVAWPCVGLIVLIPFAPWLAETKLLKRWTTGRPVRGALVRIALAGVPALVALTICGMAFYKAMQDRTNDPYG